MRRRCARSKNTTKVMTTTTPTAMPTTSSGLMERPMSWAIHTLSTRMIPLSRSTESSTAAAEYE